MSMDISTMALGAKNIEDQVLVKEELVYEWVEFY